MTCTAREVPYLRLYLTQKAAAGQLASGWGDDHAACTGEPQTYLMQVSTHGGAFKPGPASVDVLLQDCTVMSPDPLNPGCWEQTLSAKVLLKN